MTVTTDNLSAEVPDGFEQLPQGLGFNDVLQPLYRKVTEGVVAVGLRVGDQHVNMLGICHGGALMTLADMAAAQGVNHARGTMGGAPTINLSLDFVRPGEHGDWIEASCDRVDVKRRFGFASGAILGSNGLVARFNGTFYLPDHDGVLRDGNKLESFRAAMRTGDDQSSEF